MNFSDFKTSKLVKRNVNMFKEKVTFRVAVRWRGIDKVGEYKYKTKLDED